MPSVRPLMCGINSTDSKASSASIPVTMGNLLVMRPSNRQVLLCRLGLVLLVTWHVHLCLESLSAQGSLGVHSSLLIAISFCPEALSALGKGAGRAGVTMH